MVFPYCSGLHPQKINMEPWEYAPERKSIIFQAIILGFHVNHVNHVNLRTPPPPRPVFHLWPRSFWGASAHSAGHCAAPFQGFSALPRDVADGQKARQDVPLNNEMSIPSLKLTYPLKMEGWKTRFLLGWPIFRCYVSFREGRSRGFSKILWFEKASGFVFSRVVKEDQH